MIDINSFTKKVVHKLIIVLDGCVVKLRLWENSLDGKLTDNNNEPVAPTLQETQSKTLNISALDSYYEDFCVPIGTSFTKFLQKVELSTEQSTIQLLLAEHDEDKFIELLKGIETQEFIQFVARPSSRLRAKEKRVVDLSVVQEEMAELSIEAPTEDIYYNCLTIIEAHQKKAINHIYTQIHPLLNKYTSTEDSSLKDKLLNSMKQQLNNRVEILNIKNKRF